MSDRAKLKMVPGLRYASPVGSAHRSLISAPGWFENNLQFKGFGGGVPQNTETAAVNPRAGVE